jgi:hypothetical protein
MPRMSAEMAATLVGPDLPSEAVQLGISAQRARQVAALVRARTSVRITVDQVYGGVGWMRANPRAGALPLVTEPGRAGGYVFALDPVRVQRGLRPRLLDIYTRLQRTERGIIVPYADLALAPVDQAEADALKADFRGALLAVGRHV